MNAFDVIPPTKWRAGYTVEAGMEVPFFFGCADCETKDAEIAGCLSTDGTFLGVGIITKPSQEYNFPRHSPALFCQNCWTKRKGGAV